MFDIPTILFGYLILYFFVVLKLNRESSAANLRFRSETSEVTVGTVVDINTANIADANCEVVELTYRYRAVVGDLVEAETDPIGVKSEIDLLGRQLVFNGSYLAMLVGKSCTVRYLTSDPEQSKLEMFPIIKEEFMRT